ncbi:MAG TPA: hypothetical protein VG448_12600 [Solirubrobacterales bacterium]|nr:hypothetical protein [Solirubrobacterales bacterium]
MLAAAVAAMALTAVGASSASATIMAAKFSPAGTPFYLKTTGVTIKKNGGSAKSCTASNIRTEEFGSPTTFGGANESFGGVRFYCSGSPALQMAFWGDLKYDTVTGRYWLQVVDHTEETLESPFGFYVQGTGETDQWTWVNGTSTTSPSKITLNEQYVGYLYSTHERITISGTFTATTLSGGLITLTH